MTFNDSTAHISCCLDEDVVVVSFYNTTAPAGYFVLPLTINGNQIIPGDRVNVYSISAGYPNSINAIDGQLVGIYSLPSASGTAYLMKRTGASISVISDYLFKTGGIPNFISAEALPDHRALIAYSDMGKSNNGTATILEVSGDRIAGGFTDESSQCIALQSGEAGQEIEVIFDGVAELPGAVAGREITSTGVYGYCPKDGWLWVRPEWDGIVTGRYRGTGTYGATNPTSLSLGFQPSLLIIFKAAVDSNYELVAVMSKMSPIGAVYTGSPTNSAGNILQVSLTDDGISWYSKEGELFQMSGQYDYNYLAIR